MTASSSEETAARYVRNRKYSLLGGVVGGSGLGVLTLLLVIADFLLDLVTVPLILLNFAGVASIALVVLGILGAVVSTVRASVDSDGTGR